MTSNLTLALLQLPVGADVSLNVRRAVEGIRQLKAENPELQLAILPESFNAPYGVEYFAKYAESVPDGATCRALSRLAMQLGLYIIGGSIVERDAGKLYNTCTVWAPNGSLIGRHRKIHLFTMNIEAAHGGGVQFDEGAVLTAGSELTVVKIGQHKVGIGICHDKRFEELARIYRNLGTHALGASAARQGHGQSLFIVQFIVERIDFDMVEQVRRQITIHQQRRTDVYAKARADS
ncbi:omega-amidase NIT2-A isoform X3 [Drosophila persimilis]|uniref:omega-amidase NIT2-A isoform X3 n=1 Tax=Drosophila persimilis TaxID=7234 RepID=UPI000F073362|nr:omega-amidase NIT2-A isoform X3 [Drosophila persimilis]